MPRAWASRASAPSTGSRCNQTANRPASWAAIASISMWPPTNIAWAGCVPEQLAGMVERSGVRLTKTQRDSGDHDAEQTMEPGDLKLLLRMVRRSVGEQTHRDPRRGRSLHEGQDMPPQLPQRPPPPLSCRSRCRRHQEGALWSPSSSQSEGGAKGPQTNEAGVPAQDLHRLEQGRRDPPTGHADT